MEEHRSQAKTRERWPPRVGRLDETETTEYKNKEHREEEGSLSHSERASGGGYALHGVYRSREIWRLR